MVVCTKYMLRRFIISIGNANPYHIPFKDLLISFKLASLSKACLRSSFKALFTFNSSYSSCCLAASPLSTVALQFPGKRTEKAREGRSEMACGKGAACKFIL